MPAGWLACTCLLLAAGSPAAADVVPINQAGLQIPILKLYEAGRYNDVDILVGYNSDEGLSFSRERTPADFIAGVERRYGPFADKLLKAYPVAEDRVPKTARDLMRDAAFGWQTLAWARLQPRTATALVF